MKKNKARGNGTKASRAAENRGTTKQYVTADATSTGKPASADARHVIRN